MGRFVTGVAPIAEKIVADAVKGIGEAIDVLKIPNLEGVVLGGGYGRGEGGAYVSQDGKESLSNDLDFFAIASEGTSKVERTAISNALKVVADEWSSKLRIDVDFCFPKTPSRMRKDGKFLMIQELLHGYADVAGEKGEVMFAGIRRIDSGELPKSEAARLLMNRGAGLLLAREATAFGVEKSGGFIPRNINKCVLGAFDARLIIEGRYKWRQKERVEALGSNLYTAAAEWKARPRSESVCDWSVAKDEWFNTFRMLGKSPLFGAPCSRFAILGPVAVGLIARCMESNDCMFTGTLAHKLWRKLS